MILCPKHHRPAEFFCISECCQFQRRKCSSCNHSTQPISQSSIMSPPQATSTPKQSEQIHGASSYLLKDFDLIPILTQIVEDANDEFAQISYDATLSEKISRIFLSIKTKVIDHLEQAQQHLLYDLQYFYENIHNSELADRVKVLESYLNRQQSSMQQSTQQPSPTQTNSQKYIDELIAETLNTNKSNTLNLSPLALEDSKLKSIMEKLKKLTNFADQFPTNHLSYIFAKEHVHQKAASVQPQLPVSTPPISQITQHNSSYSTNIMHKHAMQVKCVQNWRNKYIISTGFDKTIKISSLDPELCSSSSTSSPRQTYSIQEIPVTHNIVCIDIKQNTFICGDETGVCTLFNVSSKESQVTQSFKAHESLVYCIRFLTPSIIISGSIGEFVIADLRKGNSSTTSDRSKIIHKIQLPNLIATEICSINQNSFLIGDSAGMINWYRFRNNQITLINKIRLHERSIARIEIIKRRHDSPIHVISGSRDQRIVIFNLISKEILQTITLKLPLVTFSLLSSFEMVSSDAQTIYFHNILTGSLLLKIIPQSKSVSCIDSNPVNKTIYFGQDKQVCSITFQE